MKKNAGNLTAGPVVNPTWDAAAGLLEQLSADTARRIEEHETLKQSFLDLKMELNRELQKLNVRMNAFEREQRETLKSVLDVLAVVIGSRGGKV